MHQYTITPATPTPLVDTKFNLHDYLLPTYISANNSLHVDLHLVGLKKTTQRIKRGMFVSNHTNLIKSYILVFGKGDGSIPILLLIFLIHLTVHKITLYIHIFLVFYILTSPHSCCLHCWIRSPFALDENHAFWNN